MRSVLSVLGGYATAIAMVLVFFGAYAAMFGAETVPGTVGMIASLIWSLVAATMAGWVTARLAPSSPMKHGYWLIALSLGIGIVSNWVVPIEGAEAEPLWLKIGILVVVVIGVPVGVRKYVSGAG